MSATVIAGARKWDLLRWLAHYYATLPAGILEDEEAIEGAEAVIDVSVDGALVALAWANFQLFRASGLRPKSESG